MPATVTRDSQMPPLRFGLSGYACSVCPGWALHEFSPLHFRACSAPCLRITSAGRFPLSPQPRSPP